MKWRVRLDGPPPALAHLRRELPTGDVVVQEDDQGTYLQTLNFEALTEATDVLSAAEALIVQLNGILSLAGHKPVSFSGRVDRDDVTRVYLADAALAVDVMITAEGVVTGADGQVVSNAGPSQTMRQLRATTGHPVVAEAYRILGVAASPSWPEFYKVYEVLSRAIGGKDPDLAANTGVSEARVEQLKVTANHQLPPAKYKITKDEGKAIVRELIEGFAKSSGV